MEKQTETTDMFSRPKEEIEQRMSCKHADTPSDLWYKPTGYPFHIDPAGRWRKEPLGEQWQPICLNAPEWILSVFTYCYSQDDIGKDVGEILKDFAYYLFRNGLSYYVVMSMHHTQGKPASPCFNGMGGTEGEAMARAMLDKKIRDANDALHAVMEKLRSASPDYEELKRLMDEYTRIHKVLCELSRLAGGRLTIPIERLSEFYETERQLVRDPDPAQG